MTERRDSHGEQDEGAVHWSRSWAGAAVPGWAVAHSCGSSDQLSKMPGINSPGEDCGAGSLLLEWGKCEIGVRQ